MKNINSFWASVLILHLLKTPENQWFSGVLGGVQNGKIDQKKVKYLNSSEQQRKLVSSNVSCYVVKTRYDFHHSFFSCLEYRK